ncbi:toprim domain-containing protein [Mucilaginibacter calamicampi]|uniref:Toprim domain-containing protein n=1 Tax=Mucilaginibacter calamicampi TaxID=1302352 RepID=A0ABW2YWY3_9SPHI
MNITEVKKIPLNVIVEKLGGRYSHTDRKGDDWYFSPFRPDEKTASFKINTQRNNWHDFGLSNTFAHRKQIGGGDVIDLWCEYHSLDRRLGVKEALAQLSGFNHLVSVNATNNKRAERPVKTKEEARYKIVYQADKITHIGLTQELVRRRVSVGLANLYLKQGQIHDTVTNKKYYGFLFENDKGGFEVSIPNPAKNTSFKTCIGSKATTRILIGEDRNSADVFEGFWDFLSWLQMKGILRPINHSYILNSTSLVGEACEKISAFNDVVKYAFLFMDHDDAGYHATDVIAKELEHNSIQVASMAQFYDGFKDLSDFSMKYKPT